MKSALSVSTLIVLAPVSHLVAISIMLFFYCAGFGGNLTVFLSLNDIFSVSMQWLVPLYASSIALPALIAFARYRSGTPYLADKIAKIEDDSERTKEWNLLSRDRRIITIAFVIHALAFISLAIFLAIDGRPFMFVLFVAILPLMTIFLHWLKASLKLEDFSHEIVIIVAPFITCAACLGFDYRTIDRNADYVDNITTIARCDDAIILKRFGDQYLSILPSSQKALLDKSCNAVIFFPGDAERESADRHLAH